jgi:predicted Zn finger-like uncharacterized protein
MNYITSCPACETQFLLTKDHLKAYKGKVQCGHCEHIFNAKNRLTEISDDIHSAAEYQASLSTDADTTQATETNVGSTPIVDEKPIGVVLSTVLESVPSLQNLASSPVESAQQIHNQNAYFDESTINTTAEVIEAYDSEPIHAPIVIEDLTADARFNKPKTNINGWLILASILFTALAALQTVYAMRTQISADYPQFKPLLVQACTLLKCEIALPKNLDLLTIDDSDMQEDENYQDVIKFTSLLINNANYAQAYPNIELTLTATDDQPVLRKIIQPSEYLKTNTDVAAGLSAREEVRVHLAINVKDLAVTGYRVLLVY